jgi:hypothetical protein
VNDINIVTKVSFICKSILYRLHRENCARVARVASKFQKVFLPFLCAREKFPKTLANLATLATLAG